MIQRRRQRKDAARGQRAEGRLEADDPAQRSRDPHRSAGVRAEAGRDGAAGDGRRRAAARTAGNACAVPRIQGVAKTGAGRGHAPCELVRGRLADGNGAAFDQRTHDVGIGSRHVSEPGGRAVAGFYAMGVDQVLDAYGQTFQRSWPALRIARVALCRSRQRAFPVDGGERAQFSLAGLCGVERLRDQRHGRDAPCGQCFERKARTGCARDHGGWRANSGQGFSPCSGRRGTTAPATTKRRVEGNEGGKSSGWAARRDFRPWRRPGSQPGHPCSESAASTRSMPGPLPCTGTGAWPVHRRSARREAAPPTSTAGRGSSAARG
ncbi:hypothetical protein D9M72_426780 [compost metagenome]